MKPAGCLIPQLVYTNRFSGTWASRVECTLTTNLCFLQRFSTDTRKKRGFLVGGVRTQPVSFWFKTKPNYQGSYFQISAVRLQRQTKGDNLIIRKLQSNPHHMWYGIKYSVCFFFGGNSHTTERLKLCVVGFLVGLGWVDLPTSVGRSVAAATLARAAFLSRPPSTTAVNLCLTGCAPYYVHPAVYLQPRHLRMKNMLYHSLERHSVGCA